MNILEDYREKNLARIYQMNIFKINEAANPIVVNIHIYYVQVAKVTPY